MESVSAGPGIAARSVVSLYRFWHGKLHLPGGGLLLRRLSPALKGLQSYPLRIEGVGTMAVDFRDYSGLLWLQHLIGDQLAAWDIETGIFSATRQFLKNGDVFWDVGANAGTVSAFVATEFKSSRICAFEPNPRLAGALSGLFATVDRVAVFPYALSDGDAEVVLTIPKGKSVGASIVGIDYVLKTSNLQPDAVEQVSVKAFSGDSLLQQDSTIAAPNVIKIDVEGHEGAVLKGLADTIATYRPVMFFEHLYLSDSDVRALVPEGYSLHSIHEPSGELTAGFERHTGHNSALIPKS